MDTGAMAESIGLKVNDPRFWDPEDLRREVDRIFDICHGCRLCFKFCGSFPTLFEMIDGKTDALRRRHLEAHPEISEAAARRRKEAEGAPEPQHEPGVEVGVTFGDELPELAAHSRDLSKAEIDRVVDLCFQCKLCYPNCPYTPPHDFALDFPRLFLRWKAHRARQQGVPLRSRLLRETALIGKVASVAPSLTNWALKNPANRLLMEKTVGIHRNKLMPTYHDQTFPAWWSRHQPNVEPAQPPREGVDAPTSMKVALFSTCLVDYNDPECGRAAVQVLEHNGVEVVWAKDQVCCGMPYLEEGDIPAVTRQIEKNIDALSPLVERGYAIVIPSPSCSLMLREEYPQIVPNDRSARLAAQTYDLHEYLYKIARDGRLKRDFKRRFGRVKYHVPCHLRLQNVGTRARDLLRLVADDVELIQECTGHDGTWSMQVENFEESLRWGRKAFDGMRFEGAEPCSLACTDCRLAALHIQQGAGQPTVHPVVALAHAYGFDVGKHLESKPVEG